MLSGDPVPPETTEIVMAFIYVALGLMTAAAEYLQKPNPDGAHAMAAAEETLRIVSGFGQKAVDERRYLYFDA